MVLSLTVYEIDLDGHAEVGPSENLVIGSHIFFGILQMTSLGRRSENGTLADGG